MEKISVREEMRIVKIHKFCCDGCGTLISEVEEFDDGWCPSPAESEASLVLNVPYWSRTYRIRKLYCQDCAEKLYRRLDRAAKELGFKEEHNED